MNKYIILGVIAVVLIVGFAHNKRTATAPTASEIASSTSTSTPLSSTDKEVMHIAWTTFQKYLTALKNHDLAQVKELSYQTSDICKDPKQQTECFKKMDDAYKEVKDLEEDQFTHSMYDAKQIIIYGDWRTVDGDLAYGYARPMIFFTRTSSGSPQILFFMTPEEFVYTLRDKGDDKDKLIAELQPRIRDSDGDTSEDEVETCSYPNAPKECVKTDPYMKDTDKDGWWDSVETWFYTK